MEYVTPVLPLVSSISIILIISGIIAINSDKIVESGMLVTMVVFIHNVLGLLMGMGISKLFGVEYKKLQQLRSKLECKTVV